MDGYGEYLYKSGDVFSGEYANGLREGRGRAIYKQGGSYEVWHGRASFNFTAGTQLD